MNRVILFGRLTRDPEVDYTQSGMARARFGVAVDRRVSKEARDSGAQTVDFINCTAFGRTAEIIGNNLTKGRQIALEGKLSARTYDAQDGTKRYIVEVIVDMFDFVGSKADNVGGGFNNNGGFDNGGYGGGGFNNNSGYGNQNSNRGGYNQGYNQPQPPQAPPEPPMDSPSANSFGSSVPDDEIPF